MMVTSTARRVVSLAAVTGALALPATAGARVAIPEGHLDYGVRIVDGDLRSQIKDGTQGTVPVWREPADVLVQVRPEARRAVPSNPSYRFLGPAGADTWLIPQAQEPRIVWLGWNTEELSAAQVSGNVRWTLAASEGPGRVAVFQTGALGQPDVLFDSSDGLPDSRAIPLGTHAHGNWAFSAAGQYRLTFIHEVTLASGEVATDTEALSVEVQGSQAGGGDGGGLGGGGGGGGAPGGDGGDGETSLGTRDAGVTILTRRARVRRGRVSLRLACRGATRCRGTLRLRATLRRGGKRRAMRFGSRRYSIGAARRATVRIRLPKRAKIIVGGRSRVTVRVLAGDARSRLILRRG